MAATVLALPASATAGAIRSGSVVPPGQSGFIPVTGLASGTGSPHLMDQVDLFLRFRYKDASLGQPGASESPRPGVNIVRDSYGVPAVTGQTLDDTWFGAGYAVAQDRLFQLEIFRRATTGHLAEVLGKGYLERDFATRRDYYTPAELQAQLERLSPELQARFQSYGDGINAWVAATRSSPTELPGEFAAIGTLPSNFAPLDLVAIGIYLARTTPTEEDPEMENARALRALGPRSFDKLLPLRVRGRYSTIPRREGLFPSQPGRTRSHEKRAFVRSARWLRGIPIPPSNPTPSRSAPATPARFPDRDGDGRAGVAVQRVGAKLTPSLSGSNAWAMRGPKRTATLFNGPQLESFEIPEQVVELEVHGPGLDARGITAAGVPVIPIGHNRHVAWGLTSGYADDDDLYVESLTSDEGYRYKGEVRRMDCRQETFSYRPPPSDFIPSTANPGQIPDMSAGSEGRRICRTVHGTVIAREGRAAFVRKYAPAGREIETLAGFAGIEQSRSLKDVDRAVAKLTWNENLIAADDRGSIGFWQPGILQLKPRGWDERLPYPGTGEAEWRGFLAQSRHPHVINPRQGYLVQWNNEPSQGWTSGGIDPRSLTNGPFHRARFLARVVAKQTRAGGGYERALVADRTAASIVQQRPLATARLRAARRGAAGPAATVLDVLLRWGGSYNETDSKGTVDSGVAAWDAFKDAAWRLAVGRFDRTAIRQLEGGRGATHLFDASNLEAYALRTLDRRGYRQAAAAAFAQLERRFGSANPATWREARQMYEPASRGAASWDPFPFYDRGTIEYVTELGP